MCVWSSHAHPCACKQSVSWTPIGRHARACQEIFPDSRDLYVRLCRILTSRVPPTERIFLSSSSRTRHAHVCTCMYHALRLTRALLRSFFGGLGIVCGITVKIILFTAVRRSECRDWGCLQGYYTVTSACDLSGTHVLPLQFIHGLCSKIKDHIAPDCICVSLIKGLHFDETGLVLISDIISKVRLTCSPVHFFVATLLNATKRDHTTMVLVGRVHPALHKKQSASKHICILFRVKNPLIRLCTAIACDNFIVASDGVRVSLCVRACVCRSLAKIRAC